MSFLSVKYLKNIVVIVGVLAVCVPLAAQPPVAPEGKSYEVRISTPPRPGTFCSCMVFDANPPACLQFISGGRPSGLFLWAFSNLDLVEGVTEVQATTGVALPAICGGPRAGFEGIALHGTVEGTSITLEAIFELGFLRVIEGEEIDDCSNACQP